MPTIGQRHKDRLVTLDSTLRFTGVPNGYVPFGNPTDGSVATINTFTFDQSTSALVVSGSISTATAVVSGTATIGTLAVLGSSTIGGNETISGSLTVNGNEVLKGILTTGSLPVTTTNALGYVNVQALSPGPLGTFLSTDHTGTVNWGVYPSIAAGWTDNGTLIYSNAGEKVRVNNLSGGSEIFNVGGTSVFQQNVNITGGGINITGPISVGNGHGLGGQALFSNGTGSAYWSTFGGLTGTANVDNAGGTQNRVPFATSFHNLDASNDLIWDSVVADRGQFRINTSSTGPLGNQKLQVNDDADGLGCAIFRTTSFLAVEINCPATNYSGSNGALVNQNFDPTQSAQLLALTTPTAISDYQFLVCASAAVPGGPLKVKAAIYSNGAMALGGTLSASSKPFAIPHPLPELSETKRLVHMAVESAKSDLIYRGKVKLLNGMAKINLDTDNKMTEGTLSCLTDLENGEVWIQNKTSFAPCQGSILGNILTINCQDETSTDTVSWLIMLERIDKTIKESKLCDSDGRLICEHDANNFAV